MARRGSGLSQADRVWFGIVIGCCVVAAVYVIAQAKAPSLDDEGCDTKRPIRQSVAFVIDRTDTLSASQIAQVQHLFGAMADTISANSRVSVFGIQGREHGVLATGFCRCRPDRGNHRKDIIQNFSQIERNYQEAFLAPARHALMTAAPVVGETNSPILEAIDELAENASFQDTANGRELVLVSDMLQNSGMVSVYATPLNGNSLQKSPTLAKALRHFSGVRVRLWVLERPRDAALQNDELTDFWIGYFENCGVSPGDLSVLRIPVAGLPH